MTRSALTVQNPGPAGATSTRTTPDIAGNYFAWPGVPVTLTIINTNAAARNMTLQNNDKTYGGQAVADTVYNIPLTTGDKTIVLDDPSAIVQADGSVYLDWDAVTGVTIAVTRAAR